MRELAAITNDSVWDHRRLWSLADMINFYLGDFMLGQTYLKQALRDAHGASVLDRLAEVPDEKMRDIATWVHVAVRDCVEKLDIDEARMTSVNLDNLIRNHAFQPVMWGDLYELLKHLSEELNYSASRQCFFHYKNEDAVRVTTIDQHWMEAIKAFKSIKPEIVSGVDCYAMGNYVGCLFHMSRIAEIGLRAIGRERGVASLKKKKPIPIEWAAWGEVFDAIEPTLENIRKWPRGPGKDAALAFYNTALTDLRHMQGFRDQTMHFRASYDFGEAESAMFRTHSLMTMLATKIDENTNRAIRPTAWRQAK
jgi:hypothetical protein